MEKIVKITAHPHNYDLRDTANESITVRELISILEDYPQDAKVVYRRNRESICGYLTEDSIIEL